jgi:uncharacterized protein (TIGR03067 family)
MRWLILSAMATLLFAPDRPPPGPVPKDELAKLDGTWAVVAYEYDGGRLPEAQIANYPRLIMKGGAYRWSNVKSGGVMTIDPTKWPKAVDYDQGPGQRYHGIYELQGDTFRDCIAPPGKERPTDFSVPPGSGRMYFIYRRVRE